MNGNSPTLVRTADDLAREYSAIVSDGLAKKITSSAPVAIFCRNGAAMIGDGVVWASKARGRVALDVINP